jgi:hypothetical protein
MRHPGDAGDRKVSGVFVFGAVSGQEERRAEHPVILTEIEVVYHWGARRSRRRSCIGGMRCQCMAEAPGPWPGRFLLSMKASTIRQTDIHESSM